MAEYVGMEHEAFLKKYARHEMGKWTLDEVKVGFGVYDCVFLKEDESGKRGCSIYPVRPHQCRTWPFWPENLKSPRSWQQASRTCPGIAGGIEAEGKFYPIDQIRIIRDSHD